MNIRPIKTAADHAWGLREIEKGMGGGVRPGTAEGDRLEVLMILVEAYERAHHALGPVDPIEAIKFRLEQDGLTSADLLQVFGTRGRASEILQRKRRMSLDIVRALHKRLGIPLDVLAREYTLKAVRRAGRTARTGRGKAA
jgi:HTH-type transcriptional regulator/antitoxin HigA